MKIGIPREIATDETRVAVVPSMIKVLMQKDKNQVLVQSGAGTASGFSDEQYQKAGAEIVPDAKKLFAESELVLKVAPPQQSDALGVHEAEGLKDGAILITFLHPSQQPADVKKLTGRKVTAFDMGFVPRITRAQSMDALSSMATIAGYKAVLMAADRLPKMFPMLMTAAGTVSPANVLVLGAGVAGLQAIATAKRLGAKVEAFDPRPAVKEQVESLGARFVEMELPEDAETEGGYAKEMSDEFLKKEQEAIAAKLPKTDVVITTAQVFGKAAPILITDEMLQQMKPGSVVIDIAAEQGGNTSATEAGKTVEKHDVKIVGAVNLAAQLPVHASQMYSKNITNLFQNIFGEEGVTWDDEVTKGACVIKDGEIVNDVVASIINKS